MNLFLFGVLLALVIGFAVGGLGAWHVYLVYSGTWYECTQWD
jgi:hypothetical protein